MLIAHNLEPGEGRYVDLRARRAHHADGMQQQVHEHAQDGGQDGKDCGVGDLARA